MKDRGQIVDQLIVAIFEQMAPAAKLAVATRITEAVDRGLSPADLLAELAAEHPELARKAIEMAVGVLSELNDGD